MGSRRGLRRAAGYGTPAALDRETQLGPAVANVVDPPGEDVHEHHDVRFLVVAPAGAVEIRNHESRELRWVTEDELTIMGVDAGVSRLARRGFALAVGVGDGP